MGSFYLTPLAATLFGTLALAWLLFVGFVGWQWIVSYTPWDGDGAVSWRRLLLGSLVQGAVGAQCIWGAVPAMWLNVFTMDVSAPWLQASASLLLYVILGPFIAALGVLHSVELALLAGVAIYALPFLAANGLGLVLRQRHGLPA
ncbi:MAG: hypothetical protein M0Z94_17530 [Dehalococcoidales bacterium]|nr:hypothetical protein [Dehalococcoidales bacterium]